MSPNPTISPLVTHLVVNGCELNHSLYLETGENEDLFDEDEEVHLTEHVILGEADRRRDAPRNNKQRIIFFFVRIKSTMNLCTVK